MAAWINNSVSEAKQILLEAGRADLAADLQRVNDAVNSESLHVFRKPESEDLLSSIGHLNDVEQLASALEGICETFDVDHCVVQVIHEGRGGVFPVRMVSTFPSEWIDIYCNQHYLHIDPFAYHAQQSELRTFFWNDVNVEAPIVKQMLSNAYRLGIGPSGFGVIIETESDDILLISVTSRQNSDIFRIRMDAIMEDFLAVADEVASAFFSLAGISGNESVQPTPDELKILRALAGGVSQSEIQHLFRIGSLPKLERAICSRLGTRTLMQAVALASSRGWLGEAALTRHEIVLAQSSPSEALRYPEFAA